jgi:protein-arginine kinase activator protein McsA
MSLKEKAKERIDIALSLSEKNQYDLWVRLEDAEQEIEEIHRKYEGLISKAEKDCADCYQDLKQKLQQLLNEFPKSEFVTMGNLKAINSTFKGEEVQNWKKKFEELLKEAKMNET